jgi:hypothetical protein
MAVNLISSRLVRQSRPRFHYAMAVLSVAVAIVAGTYNSPIPCRGHRIVDALRCYLRCLGWRFGPALLAIALALGFHYYLPPPIVCFS